MDLKQKVLNLLDRAYEEEQTFVTKLSAEERAAVGALEQWSAKDLLAHIVAWKERLVREIAAAPSSEGPSAAIDIDPDIVTTEHLQGRQRRDDGFLILRPGEIIFGGFVTSNFHRDILKICLYNNRLST